MKRIIICLIFLLLTIQLVCAAEVCVVADYGEDSGYNTEGKSPDTKCVDIDEGENGYELMESTGWELLWGPNTTYGHMLCKIKDVGTEVSGNYCEYSGDYWNFNIAQDGEWFYTNLVFDGGNDCNSHYCVKDGDFLGFAFGPSGSKPDMFHVNISDIYVDGKKQTRVSGKGGKIREVSPGSKIELEIEFENLYITSSGVEIKDISTTGTIEEIDEDNDIEKTIPDFTLGVSKSGVQSLKFEIPNNIEIKDRLLRIEVEAEDGAGIRYNKEFNYVLKIEKEQHNLQITRAELNRASYSYKENAVLSLSLLDRGVSDEDINLTIANSDLNLSINKKIVLKVSEQYDEKFNIKVPENPDKTVYPITIKATYGEDGDREEVQTVDLVVTKCESKESPVSQEEKSKPAVPTQPNEQPTTQPESAKKESWEKVIVTKEKIGTGGLPIILVTLFVILIVIIVALGAIFFVLRK